MSEARNVYPRLCWGCLGVIEDFAHDHSLMDYGGYCTDCEEHHRPYRPEIDDVLRGRPERMNDVSEREELLKEMSMSEKDTHELATGGVIEESSTALETMFHPRYTHLLPAAGTAIQGGSTIIANTSGVPWHANPPLAPWQRVGDPVVVTTRSTSTGALTEERMRQIVTETMMRVLYPEQDGSSVSHQHRRVRQWDEDGVEWRGVLYKVEKEGTL